MEAPKRRKSDLTPLGEALGRSLARGPLNFMAQKLRVFELWPRIVGPEVAARSKADLIDGTRLIVLVPAPAFISHYNYQKKDWLRRLNIELAGAAVIDEIEFKVSDKL